MAATVPGPVVNCVAYDREGRRSEISLEAISDVLAADDGSFVWVGLVEPGDALLDKMQEEFGLHDLAVEDAQHAHQRPKIEPYGDSPFVVAHTAQASGETGIAFGETHAFLGRRYLVTASMRCSTPSSTTTCRSSTRSAILWARWRRTSSPRNSTAAPYSGSTRSSAS